ncbi:MAG: 50S ribosomal protein L29 [Verrucomicrobiaceae bacterium]|nr:50S ribosomal protein L29 [Verrucomicrobiaceae bacterium]
MKIKDLKEMTIEELGTQRRDLKQEMINLRVQQQSGQLENPSRIKAVRRTIARIETVLSSRRLEENVATVEAG